MTDKWELEQQYTRDNAEKGQEGQEEGSIEKQIPEECCPNEENNLNPDFEPKNYQEQDGQYR